VTGAGGEESVGLGAWANGSSAGGDVINVGAGANTIIGGGGNDTLVFLAADSLAHQNTAEVITDRMSADHLLIAALGPGAGIFFGGDTATATSFVNGPAQAEADLQTHAGDRYIAMQVGSDVVIFANSSGDTHIASADDAIILTATSLAERYGRKLHMTATISSFLRWPLFGAVLCVCA
jgi:Ca2+-binding RTX toxin-like protein